MASPPPPPPPPCPQTSAEPYPSAVRLRESLNGHRAVFLKALYTATDAEDVTAAAKIFEKKIDVWILEILHFHRSVTGLYIGRRKAAELMVKHRSRNLTYSAALQSFEAYPTMKTLVGVRSALKELYALKNIDLYYIILCQSSLYFLPLY